MKITGWIITLQFIVALPCFAQVETLVRLGQTPGGAGYHVNYDSASQRLFVGCGTSIWIYDTQDTTDIHPIAKRPLLGLVNETDLWGNILFVAATHDGVWDLQDIEWGDLRDDIIFFYSLCAWLIQSWQEYRYLNKIALQPWLRHLPHELRIAHSIYGLLGHLLRHLLDHLPEDEQEV